MPFGLLGAPFTFGEAMAYLFRDLEFVVCYFDDILIFSNNITDHLKHLKMTLDRLAEYGFIINDDKWQLFQEEVLFLGYRVSGKGMCLRVWPSKPLDLISIDFLVDLPKTARGNVHILVINDHFSRFIRLYAIKDRRAETAAKYVADFCLDFGIPRKSLSDKDPAYEATLFKELMRILQIKKIRTSGYRPQTNGLTEQSNSVIKKYLTIYLDDNADKDNWDLY